MNTVSSVIKRTKESKEIFQEAEICFGRCFILKTVSQLLWKPWFPNSMFDFTLQCSPVVLLFSLIVPTSLGFVLDWNCYLEIFLQHRSIFQSWHNSGSLKKDN